jgi:hypothetical protein
MSMRASHNDRWIVEGELSKRKERKQRTNEVATDRGQRGEAGGAARQVTVVYGLAIAITQADGF